MTHARQPQPCAKPRGWPGSSPEIVADETEWEPIDLDLLFDLLEEPAQDVDSDATPPMPRPALRSEERGAERTT